MNKQRTIGLIYYLVRRANFQLFIKSKNIHLPNFLFIPKPLAKIDIVVEEVTKALI